jgi:hypothetical protein
VFLPFLLKVLRVLGLWYWRSLHAQSLILKGYDIEQKINNENKIVLGSAFGAAIGSAIGVLTDNLALFISLGVSFGVFIGIMLTKRSKNENGHKK